jgi:hypothetical protein
MAELIPLRFQQLTGSDAIPARCIRVHQAEVKGELFRLIRRVREVTFGSGEHTEVTFRLAF